MTNIYFTFKYGNDAVYLAITHLKIVLWPSIVQFKLHKLLIIKNLWF